MVDSKKIFVQPDEFVEVNRNTGEITDTKKAKFNMDNMRFRLFYAENIATMFRWPIKNKRMVVLSYIIDNMNDSNIIAIMSYSRNILAKQLKVSDKYIMQLVNELIDEKIIYRITRGEYIVNPFYFAHGQSKYNVGKLRWQFEALLNAKGEVAIEYSSEMTHAELTDAELDKMDTKAKENWDNLVNMET